MAIVFLLFIGTNFSTIYKDGVELVQATPLNLNDPWVSKDGAITIPCEEVCDTMSEIGTELTLLQMSKSEISSFFPSQPFYQRKIFSCKHSFDQRNIH